MNPPQQPDHASDHDDEAWFDAVAGRRVPDASGDTAQEAALLRAVAQAGQPEPKGAPTQGDLRTQRLLERAHQQGVLAPRHMPSWMDVLTRWRQQPVWAGAALAVVMVGVAVGTLWRGAPQPDAADSVERAGTEVQQLQVAQPAVTRETLANDLRAAGAQADEFERLGRLGLDVHWPAAAAPAVGAVLHRQGLRLPAGTALRIEIEPRP